MSWPFKKRKKDDAVAVVHEEAQTREPICVFILSYNRPLYLWASLDSLYRETKYPAKFIFADNASTDPLVKEVVEGFERRNMFHAVYMCEDNSPHRLRWMIDKHRGEIGPYFAFVESDVVVEPSPRGWLGTMVEIMNANPKMWLLGSHVDKSDFVDLATARRTDPEMSEAQLDFLVRPGCPERAEVWDTPELIEPHNPPGRLLCFRTELLDQVGIYADGPMYQKVKALGYESKIATTVRHRHLSFLNFYDYHDYDGDHRDNFFRQMGSDIPIRGAGSGIRAPVANQDAPEFDDELRDQHLARTAAAFPGVDYYEVLHWLHEILKPETYVEIGCRRGRSLAQAMPPTKCIAIDPEPALEFEVAAPLVVFKEFSDDFFRRHRLPDVLAKPSFDLAFIDGSHLWEDALSDFVNLEPFAGHGSVIVLHDCLPLDDITSARTRTTHFYSGDVWKLMACLIKYRPDLDMCVIRTGPTGLALVRCLDPDSCLLSEKREQLLAEYTPLGFADFASHSESLRSIISNTHDDVKSWLLRNSVGS